MSKVSRPSFLGFRAKRLHAKQAVVIFILLMMAIVIGWLVATIACDYDVYKRYGDSCDSIECIEAAQACRPRFAGYYLDSEKEKIALDNNMNDWLDTN